MLPAIEGITVWGSAGTSAGARLRLFKRKYNLPALEAATVVQWPAHSSSLVMVNATVMGLILHACKSDTLTRATKLPGYQTTKLPA